MLSNLFDWQIIFIFINMPWVSMLMGGWLEGRRGRGRRRRSGGCGQLRREDMASTAPSFTPSAQASDLTEISWKISLRFS